MVSIELLLRFENATFSVFGMVLGVALVSLLYFSYKRLRTAEKRLELVQWRTLRTIIKFANIGMKVIVVVALSMLLATPYLPMTIQMPVDAANETQIAQYNVSVMLLMDTSYSMNTSDLKPTRLQVAKSAATFFVNKMGPGDLVGFMPFAGSVYKTLRPTSDKASLTEFINNQTTHPSTAIGTALEAAIGILGGYSGGRSIVLFSDGKNNVGIDPTRAVESSIAAKIPVFTIFVGTYGIWEADPIALRNISEQTGGKFFEIRSENLESLLTEVSKVSLEAKATALKMVSDTLTIEAKDYETPTLTLSALLIAALFLTWFFGV
jgi:Ca-activated chloride channel family protein